MSLRAPEDKKSISARINWLLRQIKADEVADLHVRIKWPGASVATQHSVAELRTDVNIANEGKEHLTPVSFHLFLSKRLGVRFTQQTNFIEDLEKIVPSFYGLYGSHLAAWKKPAPVLKAQNSEPEDVSPDAISEDADNDAFDT